MRYWVSRTLAVLLLVPGLGMVAFASASAAECHSEGSWVKNPITEVLMYKVTKECPAVVPSSDPAGVAGPPPCDVATASPATFCWGSYPC
jgi:hypothetical protein